MEKLINIQSELKAPKNQYNDFGRYKYRSCEDILEAVKPLLSKYVCTLTISDKIITVNDRSYVEATATFSDGNSIINITASAREEQTKKGMDGSQITGASSSYARKYALNGLFLIDDNKDSDGTNKHESYEQQIKAAKTVKELEEIWHGLNESQQQKYKTLVTNLKTKLK